MCEIGFGHIPQDIKKLCPQSKILTGLASYDSTASNTDIHKWLTKIKYFIIISN